MKDLIKVMSQFDARSAAEVEAWEAERTNEERERAWRASGVPERFLPLTLGTFRTDDAPHLERLRASCMGFFQKVKDGGYCNLVLCGDRGTGKTSAACAVLHTLVHTPRKVQRVEGVTEYHWGQYVTAYELATAYHYAEGYSPEKSLKNTIKEFGGGDVLIVDEVDAETERNNGPLFATVDRRSACRRSTVIITNYSWDSFCGAMGAAIMSRLGESLVYCDTAGAPDLRRKN